MFHLRLRFGVLIHCSIEGEEEGFLQGDAPSCHRGCTQLALNALSELERLDSLCCYSDNNRRASHVNESILVSADAG